MIKTIFRSCLLLALSVFLLQGCGSTQSHKQTGFLANYEQLTPSKEFSGAKIYVAPEFNAETLAGVKKVYVQPFEIWLTQASLPFLGSQQVKELAGYFHAELSKALSPDYELVDRMGVNTLGIRGAFSEIQLSDPELSATDFIPFRVVMNAGNLAYLEATGQKDLVTQVGIEVEFTHIRPRNVVFAMTSVKTLDTTVDKGVEGNIQAIKQVLDIWIANFANKLAQVRQAN